MDLHEAATTWLNLSDEASAEDFTRADFDEAAMQMADEFAARFDLPKFDEVADVDKAQQWLEDSGLGYLVGKPDREPVHTIRGRQIGREGVPYGTLHDRDCPSCKGAPYGTAPNSEAYWAS